MQKQDEIFATEEEVFEGGQPWDMNPVIFYRVKSPVTDLSSLPTIDLLKHFTQKEQQSD